MAEERRAREAEDRRNPESAIAGPIPPSGIRRRRFLQALSAAPVGLLGARELSAGSAALQGEPGLPRVPFGRHRISRLVCGSNPFHAGSHLSVFVNHDMQSWYTEERILATLRRCQEVGVNLWQGNDRHFEKYRRLREAGGEMLYLSLGNARQGAAYLKELAAAGAIGVAHHGETTDQLFKAGRLDEILDYLKLIRDSGLQVGVSTHMPDVVDAVESKGWDVDFYMTCVYERHRSREDLVRLLGQAPVQVGEVYLEDDPPRMFRAIQQTKRTCLAFKILAAGRLSDRKGWVEDAFRRTFESIKPTDAVIVGMWDKYSDQPAENAEHVRKYSPLSRMS